MHRIALGSDKNVHYHLKILTNKDVMASWRRPKRFYGAFAACNCISTVLLGEWLRSRFESAERTWRAKYFYIASRHALCALTMCTRSSSRFSRLYILICITEWESETNKNLQQVNKSYVKKIALFWWNKVHVHVHRNWNVTIF